MQKSPSTFLRSFNHDPTTPFFHDRSRNRRSCLGLPGMASAAYEHPANNEQGVIVHPNTSRAYRDARAGHRGRPRLRCSKGLLHGESTTQMPVPTKSREKPVSKYQRNAERVTCRTPMSAALTPRADSPHQFQQSTLNPFFGSRRSNLTSGFQQPDRGHVPKNYLTENVIRGKHLLRQSGLAESQRAFAHGGGPNTAHHPGFQ